MIWWLVRPITGLTCHLTYSSQKSFLNVPLKMLCGEKVPKDRREVKLAISDRSFPLGYSMCVACLEKLP